MFVQSVAGFEWDEGNWGKCQQHGVSAKATGHKLRILRRCQALCCEN